MIPCFSCDERSQKYIDGLCEECHQMATAETKEEFEALRKKDRERLEARTSLAKVTIAAKSSGKP